MADTPAGGVPAALPVDGPPEAPREPVLEAVALATAQRVEVHEARLDALESGGNEMAKHKEPEAEEPEGGEPETPEKEPSEGGVLADVVKFFNWLGDF